MASAPSLTTNPAFSFSDSDSDSGNEATGASNLALHDSIFRAYLETSGNSLPDLSKIRSFLHSSRSGALSCLICLEKIRPIDPTWSCSSSCYAVFHLLCIQSWARQASAVAAERAAARLSRAHFPAAPESSDWHCPKCRFEYTKSQIPRLYLCFCGKVENPALDPWTLPHSCGEVCDRPLRGDCAHRCLVLCHPGPCPPCPKLVTHRCFCGAREEVRRCNLKSFSCNEVCSRLLECGIHHCSQSCHEGSCPPCRKKGLHHCFCGKKEELRECCDGKFRCDLPCDRMLGCGKHSCNRGCHAGPCGDCPLQGKRTCPCGKVEHKGLACDVAVPTCGSTCEKMLSCGFHRCPERCHRGPCIETCRTVVWKSCRCRSLKKEVPCYQDLVCERKCQRVRDCGRHACRRRCCDGDCPPCSEICGRKLRCNNHKCPSPCHRGACAPCPLMVSISCFCGETHFEVPCGIEAGQKPPRCSKLCTVTPLCRHGLKCKPHRCHYGACPLCQLICEEELPCGHACKLRCHGPKPAPNPEFSLKPKKIKPHLQPKCKPGTPCAPCQEVVLRSCLGQHIGAERPMLCSDRSTFSCSNLCGNLLQCGNHYCEKPCHRIVNAESNRPSDNCDECELPCQKERKPLCPHPCPLPCHTGKCPTCKVLIKRPCHCGSLVHVFECTFYTELSDKEKERVRSCGGPCHRKLQNCYHLCPAICHPGQCPSPEKCCKKVTVRCTCQNLKKEWQCHEVQSAYRRAGRDPKDIPKTQIGLGLLPCNSDCASKVKVVESEIQQRKPKVVEEEDALPGPKRRKRRERVQKSKETSKVQAFISSTLRYVTFIFIGAAVVAALYYSYKGLFWLSDWMNEVEEKRLKNKSSRFA
ncbi:hypothetical protein H6P81_006334 [Aristolochia fimbriata]|uniref:NF-X1-type domain-containing protein n=1 Tax=Aristolochia fimbriata TaxID=158543 RepID=A0AAV7EZ72_ARIFI|nr:hypothetical protein H6P81_006334 [Aristolochia fimbriata]